MSSFQKVRWLGRIARESALIEELKRLHLACHIPGDPNLLGLSPVAGVQLAKAYRRWRKERRGMLATNRCSTSTTSRIRTT